MKFASIYYHYQTKMPLVIISAEKNNPKANPYHKSLVPIPATCRPHTFSLSSFLYNIRYGHRLFARRVRYIQEKKATPVRNQGLLQHQHPYHPPSHAVDNPQRHASA